MRGYKDLRAASAASVLCALVALFVPYEAVRAVAAVPLCLVFPGYAIVSAAFGRQKLGGWQLSLLTLGMSLVALALGSLVLNYVPGGIRGTTWALLLVLVVVSCCGLAALRRGAPARRPAARQRRGGGRSLPWSRLKPRDHLMLGGAVVAAAAALIVAQIPVSATHATGYTQLWMLPKSGDAGSVRVGVASEEQSPLRYKLEVSVGSNAPVFSTDLGLQPGSERVFSVPLKAAPKRGSVRVAALLIRADRFRHVYRRVTNWLPSARSTSR
jgi:uncharacterized membrane protein